MRRSVFISYAHTANQGDAEALAANLGDLAFLDVAQIEDGDPFPQHLLDNLLDASVMVIFVSKAYSERPVCRLEMRLALAGDPSTSNLVLAMGEGARFVLDSMPTSIADQNWPPADATERLGALVRKRLAVNPSPLRQRLSDIEVQRLKVAFLNESNMLDPQPLGGIVSLPEGILGSIDSRFMGRVADLRHIHEVLTHGSGARLIGRVTAAGGFGKTRLAIEYLYRYGPRYYPGGLFWINASSNSIQREFWRILSSLDDTVPKLADMVQHRRDVRGELEQALRTIRLPALYVIDNIPEAAAGEDPRSIAEFCPAVGSVTILATSRQDNQEECVKTIQVDTLGRDAAILLLTEGVAGSGRLSWGDWGHIAEWVGDLPLALDLLNRCLVIPSITGEQLLQRTKSVPGATKELDRMANVLKGQVVEKARLGITEAFYLSFEKLDETARSAAMILAQFSPAPIPEILLNALPDECNNESVKAALSSRHFIIYDSKRSAGVMHPLMADFFRNIAGTRSQEAIALAMLAMARTFPNSENNKTRKACEALLPHALAILQNAPETIEGFDDEGWLLHRKTKLTERVARYHQHMRNEEFLDAALHFDDNRAAAVVAAKRFAEFNTKIRRRMMRMAYEQPDNQILQPIRAALESQPVAFQKEIMEAVKNAAQLTDELRHRLVQDDTTRDKATADLLSVGLEKFPIHLQDDLKNGFQHSPSQENQGIIEAIWAYERQTEARDNLYRTLDIAKPIISAKKKKRWNWLKFRRDK